MQFKEFRRLTFSADTRFSCPYNTWSTIFNALFLRLPFPVLLYKQLATWSPKICVHQKQRNRVLPWFFHISEHPKGWQCSRCILQGRVWQKWLQLEKLYNVLSSADTCKNEPPRDAEVDGVDAENYRLLFVTSNLPIRPQVKKSAHKWQITISSKASNCDNLKYFLSKFVTIIFLKERSMMKNLHMASSLTVKVNNCDNWITVNFLRTLRQVYW